MDGRVAGILQEHAPDPHHLIPILQSVQAQFGYLPKDAMADVARFLGVPAASVYEVATFYAQFHLTRQGKHNVRVCLGTACHVRGARQVLRAVQRKLGIRPGETTPDFMFSLERVACFGSCALAPVIVVDGRAHGRVTPEKAVELLEKLE
jgi:NADH-quinone oxidoreductase subunit E